MARPLSNHLFIFCIQAILLFGLGKASHGQSPIIDSLIKAKDYSNAIELLEEHASQALEIEDHREFLNHEDKICKLMLRQKRCEDLQLRVDGNIVYSHEYLEEPAKQIARFLFYKGGVIQKLENWISHLRFFWMLN